MNDLFQPDSNTNGPEPLDEGGTWLLDLVSAVDHLRRGYRPGFTVWDALDEAVDWANVATDTELAAVDVTAAQGDVAKRHEAMQSSVRAWVLVMADRYNAGHHWPHPSTRRSFPPRLRTSGES